MSTSKKRKVYLSGPMRGIPEFNFPAFFAAAEKLRAEGYFVYNPAQKDEQKYGEGMSKGNLTGDEDVAKTEYNFNLREALGKDLAYICKNADIIAMLPGWENSKGARAEWATAVAIGLEVMIL